MGYTKPGEIFDRKYLIKKLVAQGAMGSVYKAEDLETKKIVAIKIPHEGYDKDVISLQRFRQAEKIGYLLEHENIVKVYVTSQKNEEIPYCVMEYVDGPSLQNMIERYLRINIEDAVDYTIQICNALTYLRHEKVIHHDIKPANILVGENKIVKLTDFGIAFSKGLQAVIWASLVRVGGTPAYMAPEKVQDQAMDDYRSDIYSVGILMYHMITGKLPFSGSGVDIINNQLTNNFLYPSRLNQQISAPLEKIIIKAMSPNLPERYQYAAELKEDLLKISKAKISAPAIGRTKSEDRQSVFLVVILVIVAVLFIIGAISFYKKM